MSERRVRGGQGEEVPLTYAITEPYIGTKEKSCVEVCPVDSIYPEDEVPEDMLSYVAKASDFFE